MVHVALLLSAWLSASSWQRQADVDGVSVETRAVAGSSFEEVRLTAQSPHPPSRLCSAVWGEAAPRSPEPGFKLRRVLRESKDERLTYEQISAAIVSDRDYTLLAKRLVEPDLGLCQVLFETRNQDGPPPQPGMVRIPRIEGSWTLEPAPNGAGTLITYVIFSDPGGGVPAWMSRGAQRSSAISWMKRILARAQ